MKKLFSIVAFLAIAGVANAEMDNQGDTFTLVTTNADTYSVVLRGEMEAVWVDVAATKTNIVTITDAFGYTNFTKTVSADQYFPIRVPLFDRAGSAITFTGGGATNDTLNVHYGKYPLAGLVTIDARGAANTTGTNAVTVQIIYRK